MRPQNRSDEGRRDGRSASCPARVGGGASLAPRRGCNLPCQCGDAGRAHARPAAQAVERVAMIYRRAIAKLRAQDWFAIGIEFAIVVAGVFVGNWVNDWSQGKAEEREAKVLVVRLRPQLERLSAIEQA